MNHTSVPESTTKLECLCASYEAKDIYNLDETGLFYKIVPNRTMCLKGEKYIGGKASMERLAVMLCCDMTGDLEKLLVIIKVKK